MKCSVLVNNFNYANYVCHAVHSALEQTRVPDEIIVIDDGSTDSSIVLLQREFGAELRVKIISKENGGQLSAFNRGHQHASGEIIFFLDADDLYKEDYIERALSF